MTEDYEYFLNKNPERTYFSKSLSFPNQLDRKIRYASKVIDSSEFHSFALENDEHVIRVTDGGRQEIVAKFYEDTRGINVLTIQRFTTNTGIPHKTSFSFIGDEIVKFIDFINGLKFVQLPNHAGLNIADSDLKKLLLSPEQVKNLIVQNQDLVLHLARSDITKSDIVALGYRKKQLECFGKMLSDSDYFEKEKRVLGLTDEAVWQSFFERNKWIFGYGLTYLFLSGLDDKKLEQVAVGYSFVSSGKRADALLKTKGIINSLCFVEIKKHTTALIKNTAYRSGCWSPSDELSGGIAQIQGTIEKSIRTLTEKIEPKDDVGNPTGEHIFTYQPRAFLVVGTLAEFQTENGVNTDKYRSFELYRRNINSPEIITFDELYERAKFIVHNS